ncbi:hypothetical protein [Pelagibacterium xiamenense]|uniref:hypothetical protein n=1 Tax=Pelagibacterium xiamenense TaxID=2901140 RepID=UPI001E3886DE|nr:hypothetical protein [Pelagibacterium xiamenense]MCD7061040.1 hypothetical protein [Pelagibacterium xiamenense]
MGRISNQIRQLDVAGWGIAALLSGALAVLGANLSAFMPPNLLAGLHATRIQGGSFNQLRAQLAEVAEETTEINREYRSLLTRFDLLDDSSGDAVRRLAAVENSLPLLIEALPLDSDIDRALLTASITEAGGETTSVDGGEVHVQRTELFPDADSQAEDEAAPVEQPMPPVLAETQPAHVEADQIPAGIAGELPSGIAIGEPQPRDAIAAAWEDILRDVGALVLGLEPRVLPAGEGSEVQIVAGPLPDLSSAEALCTRIARAGLSCLPAGFEGTPLPPR